LPAQWSSALEAFDELMEYALRGHVSAMIYFSTIHGFNHNRLHPDIRYALKMQDMAHNSRYGWTESWLEKEADREAYTSGQELTPMRRAFIEEAIAKGDWKAVLDTLDPCAPPVEASRI
jgi:hypothetical protein